MAKYSVFLVDDSEDIREFLTMELESDFRVRAFEGGPETLDALKNSSPPDLFILDFKMPQMNGLELSEKIMDLEIQSPIVFLTGAADKNMALNAIEMNVFAVIEKPCSTTQLITVANKAIASHKSMVLMEDILTQFNDFTNEVKSWSNVTLDHMVALENQIFDANIRLEKPADIRKDLDIRKQLRLAEKSVHKTQLKIEEMYRQHKNLQSLLAS